MMRVLLLIPPYIPSYFNAGHHLPLFSVAAFLRLSGAVAEVRAVDGAALNMNWMDLVRLLGEQFNLIGLLNDFDAVDTFPRTMSYIRELSPESRVVTFGRLSQQCPGPFRRWGLDAIHVSGDPEVAVLDYARHLAGGSEPAGVELATLQYAAPAARGSYLAADEWVLPDVREIPYADYDRLYADDLNKFCGIPMRRELVVPVARGCPVNCSFCDVPRMQGLKERRLSVARTIDYIETSFARTGFDYVSFYAPTFTLNRPWVRAMCGDLIGKGARYPWKCVTTLTHLSADLIATMGQAGCRRISIGVETLGEEGGALLPKGKQKSEARLIEVAGACREAGIELNCFIVAGLPSDSFAAFEATVDSLRTIDCRVRPTVLAPYHLLNDLSTDADLARMNRQLFADSEWPEDDRRAAYQMLYNNRWDRPTRVHEAIPTAAREPTAASN